MTSTRQNIPPGYSKEIHIIGGGTVFHVRAHLALSAVAYGTTARRLYDFCQGTKLATHLWLTKMAGDTNGPETNDDVEKIIDDLIQHSKTKIIFFNAAMVDFEGWVDIEDYAGKYAERLSSAHDHILHLTAANKIIRKIRKERKDIFLVGFKTTCGENPHEQYRKGLKLLKESSCNLVLANDIKTRVNMIITPEEAKYHQTTDRDDALRQLVDMSILRSHLTFTRSTVVDGVPISWKSTLVPSTLRTVVEWCINNNAYKPFNGATVGHFAAKIGDGHFITSRRKTNFNDLPTIGMVEIKTDGDDSVIAYGAKPSVGGQSQRIIFSEHPEYDCIVHFHCPKWDHSQVPVVSQREYECGSHECGKNTSRGLQRFGNLSAVMLDNHGPNIVFNHNISPQEVIDFINENFDLSAKTGGPV